jgi:hypothetical protein
MQNERMSGVEEIGTDIGSAPLQFSPVDVAPTWVFQSPYVVPLGPTFVFAKLTKHSVFAYVPVFGRANPHPGVGEVTEARLLELDDADGVAATSNAYLLPGSGSVFGMENVTPVTPLVDSQPNS